MLSAWSKPTRLYLGHGLALLRLAGKSTRIHATAATLPLDRLLDLLDEDIPKGGQIEIYLSGAMCPATNFVLPKGLAQWSERSNLVRAWEAKNLNVDPAELLCELDRYGAPIAATLGTAVDAMLRRWADSKKLRIVSMQPLWALATQWTGAGAKTMDAILLQEPDSLTLVSSPNKGPARAVSLLGSFDTPQMQARLRQVMVTFGLQQERVCRLGFAAQPKVVLGHAPRTWAVHWCHV